MLLTAVVLFASPKELSSTSEVESSSSELESLSELESGLSSISSSYISS